jgi:hypothetical protein
MKLIEEANRQAVARILGAEPRLIDIVPAREALTGLKDRMILHAGPPITWDRMCGPMRGAVAGAIVFEGWADDLKSATKLAEPSFRRGGTDDWHDHRLNAAFRGRKCALHQSGLLRDQ